MGIEKASKTPELHNREEISCVPDDKAAICRVVLKVKPLSEHKVKYCLVRTSDFLTPSATHPSLATTPAKY